MEPWRRLDFAPAGEARTLLAGCCGSARWVDAMLARRPFGSTTALVESAASIWRGLSEADWLEAFSHHPRIGDKRADGIAKREQSGVASASEEIVRQLADANREYEARFGYIFIICATGKSADSMLEALRARLGNEADREIRIAAEEQLKITQLRLAGLGGPAEQAN
jgi:2-oxo-4-hydroxy-4-carboxy-5-ureidoimidazoline decarboxylase